jgi:hypothetical protein
MRHMEQTRRVAVDNLVPSVPLDAYPRTGSTCACRCAYSLHAINSFLLPPGTPRADSSVTDPSHDQLCSTSSHRRCLPPAGHTAVSPPRLHTTLTGAPFRSSVIFMSPFPQSQRSPRFPSHLLSAYHPLHPLIPATTQFVPHSFSKPYFAASQFPLALTFVVSQLPLLQSSVQTSWARFMLVLCITFNPLAVSGLRVLSLLLPKSPLPLPPELPLHTCGRLAACRPPNTSPPDQSELSILSVEPATSDARARHRHISPRRLPHHI